MTEEQGLTQEPWRGPGGGRKRPRSPEAQAARAQRRSRQPSQPAVSLRAQAVLARLNAETNKSLYWGERSDTSFLREAMATLRDEERLYVLEAFHSRFKTLTTHGDAGRDDWPPPLTVWLCPGCGGRFPPEQSQPCLECGFSEAEGKLGRRHLNPTLLVAFRHWRELREKDLRWAGAVPVLLRYGRPKPSGESKSFARHGDRNKEPGVSVFFGEVLPNGAARALPRSVFEFSDVLGLRDLHKRLYVVEGEVCAEAGSDGEPLLRDTRIVREVRDCFFEDPASSSSGTVGVAVGTTEGWAPVEGPVGAGAGTFPGAWLSDPDGRQWYAKTPDDPDQARAEWLAGHLYREAGVLVPEVRLVWRGETLAVASAAIPGATPCPPGDHADLRSGFVVDAWLANWDALLNLLADADGRVWRIDYGGALHYRARGGRKPFTGGPVEELDSMRDPARNRAGATAYVDVSPQDLQAGAERVAAIPDECLDRVLEEAGFDPGTRATLAQALKARRDWLAREFLPLRQNETLSGSGKFTEAVGGGKS